MSCSIVVQYMWPGCVRCMQRNTEKGELVMSSKFGNKLKQMVVFAITDNFKVCTPI